MAGMVRQHDVQWWIAGEDEHCGEAVDEKDAVCQQLPVKQSTTAGGDGCHRAEMIVGQGFRFTLCCCRRCLVGHLLAALDAIETSAVKPLVQSPPPPQRQLLLTVVHQLYYN